MSEFLEWAGRQCGGFGSLRDRVYDRDMITSWAQCRGQKVFAAIGKRWWKLKKDFYKEFFM